MYLKFYDFCKNKTNGKHFLNCISTYALQFSIFVLKEELFDAHFRMPSIKLTRPKVSNAIITCECSISINIFK